MGISIKKDLSASPDPAKLKRKVEFSITLKSDKADGESVNFTYKVPSAATVKFITSGNSTTKSVKRKPKVKFTETKITHSLEMGPKQTQTSQAKITLEMKDSSGSKTVDSVRVTFK